MDDFASQGKTSPTVVAVEEVGSSHSPSSDHDPEKQRRVFMIKTPWFGISALAAVVLLSVGQLLVLLFADNKASSEWSTLLSPNVCLSMLNNVATLFLTFSIGHGIAIAWWRKAMSETSIAKLQKSWSFSVSILSILQGITHFNVIALAALMAKVAVIDGVLFQRAIGTDILISWNTANKGHQSFKNITAYSRTEFPLTGYIQSSEGPLTVQTEYWYSINLYNWLSLGTAVNSRDDAVSDCEGVGCVYGLAGIGFAVDCSDSKVTDTFDDLVKASNGTDGKTIFSVDWEWHFPDDNKNYSSIMMNITRPSKVMDKNICPTTIHIRQCEFRPALINYTVAYTNLSSTGGSEKSSSRQLAPGHGEASKQVGISGSRLTSGCLPPEASWVDRDWPKGCGIYDSTYRQIVGTSVIKEMDIYEPRLIGGSKLAGIFTLLSEYFSTKTKLRYNNADNEWWVEETGWLAAAAAYVLPNETYLCNYTYFDQTETIVNKINLLMFQSSVNYDLWPWPDETEGDISVAAIQYYRDVYYLIDFRFAWAAIGLTVLVVLCVLPSYWQFWILGREVTLGPLEIANAFRGPILVQEQSEHHDVGQIMKSIGHKKLRYQPAARPGEQPGFHAVS